MRDSEQWLARLGVLYPASGLADHELATLAPPGVSVHVTRLNMPLATRENLLQLAKEAEEGARLLAQARVDMLAFNCTLGSLLGGPGYDRTLAGRLTELTGRPATTTATAVLAALAHLNLYRVVLVTPYIQAMNEAEEEFLRAAGHQMVARFGLGLIDPAQQAAVAPETWLEQVLAVAHPQADGYLLSCSGIRVAGVIAELEERLGRPVVTSQQALIWHCLDLLGLPLRQRGYGRLLEE